METGEAVRDTASGERKVLSLAMAEVGVAAGLVVALCGLGQVVLNATSSGSRIGIGLGVALVVSGVPSRAAGVEDGRQGR